MLAASALTAWLPLADHTPRSAFQVVPEELVPRLSVVVRVKLSVIVSTIVRELLAEEYEESPLAFVALIVYV